ncbi:MAG: efflux RND transporter periplasmic adaptor subunit [Desulfopila sp.]
MRRVQWIAAILFLALLTASCRKEEDREQTAATALPSHSVTVCEVQSRPIPHRMELAATVVSTYRAEMASKISGRITAMAVVLGSTVRRGDLLLQLDAEETSARLARAEVELDQARRNLQREKKLLSKKASTPETVKTLTEGLAMAEASHREARILKSYTRLVAPFDGQVTEKVAGLGDLATPGRLLLVIEDHSRLQVMTEIPERPLLQVKPGDRLPVELPAAGLTLVGTVAEVAPGVDPATRSGTVKLDIVAQPALRPGQFARVLVGQPDIDTLAVPQRALVRNGQMELLFVVDNDIARLRLVRTGDRFGEDIEILAGVERGEWIVVQGQHQLVDSQPVIVHQEESFSNGH